MNQIQFSILFLCIAHGVATAAPIQFTHEGNGSGLINGEAFANSAFVINAFADTDNRVQISSDIFTIEHDTASISIDGIGDFVFTTPTLTFVNDDIVGFSRSSGGGNGGADLYNGPSSPTLSPYVLLTPIGPITGDARLLQWALSPTITTSGGVLEFASMSGIRGTFSATIIPEPTRLTLLVLGTLVASGNRRFKHR